MMHPVPEEQRSEDEWEFYAEALQAHRAWRVVLKDDVFLLKSLHYTPFWLPRTEFTADCLNKDKYHAEGSPNIDCGCGVYSVKDLDYAIEWAYGFKHDSFVIYGNVSIWGSIFKFEYGFLSQYAYPSLFYVRNYKGRIEKEFECSPDELATEISNSYRVEAVVQ